MLTPTSHRRRRRRRVPWLLVGLLVVLAVAAAVYVLVFRHAGPATLTQRCRTPAPSHSATAPSPAAISVRVLNSTKRDNLAHQVAGVLGQRGFVVTQVGNAADPSPLPGAAELRYGSAGAAAAKVLAVQLPTVALVPDARADASVDLVLGTAFDRLRTPAEVAAVATPPPAGPRSPAVTASCRRA